MEITSSYQVEILSNTDMKNTVQIYRRALAFVINVCNKEWVDISSIESQVQKKSFVEKLIHPTKNNPNPKYPFDIKGSEFYKFPSYLKRAVIAEARFLHQLHHQEFQDAGITLCPRNGLCIHEPGVYNDYRYQ